MVKVKIRGIYTTALTKLLLDNGFEIVQPSIEVQKRFNLKYNESPFDLNIYDRLDKQGVYAYGDLKAIEAFCKVLRENLLDVIIRRFEKPFNTLIQTQFLDVEFPKLSKEKLDEIRNCVIPTIKGHHYYKACGINISSTVDMAEKLISKGNPIDKVEELLKLTIKNEFPNEGCEVNIEHVKLNGNIINLGKAIVKAYNEDGGYIELYRTIKREGLYNGLKIAKEIGDYAITEVKLGEWYLKTRYFSFDNQYKGMYININTPIELYPRCIRYVDLEVDVCVEPEGDAWVIDEDKLNEAVKKGIVSESLLNIVRDKIKELLKSNIGLSSV
ncbi:MAG: DUF402 domain-containing protein [Nitrososphaerales archaeon]